MSKYRPIIAVDFDGTITKTNNYPFKPTLEDLQDNCVAVLQHCKEHGFIIILWTCREGAFLQDAVDFCKEVGIPIDYVNENCKEVIDSWGSTSRKIFANYYVDDLNLGGFPGWDYVAGILLEDRIFKKEA